jgi:hypothetical protein
VIRDLEDRGFEAEKSLPPALPPEAIDATDDNSAQAPCGPVHQARHDGKLQRAAKPALLTVLIALVLTWFTGIVVLIRWAAGALFG